MESQLAILLVVLFIILVFVAMEAVSPSPDDRATPEVAGIAVIPTDSLYLISRLPGSIRDGTRLSRLAPSRPLVIQILTRRLRHL